jgi:hypothetical protein
MDLAFPIVLVLVNVSGFVVLMLRETTAMAITLTVHLAVPRLWPSDRPVHPASLVIAGASWICFTLRSVWEAQALLNVRPQRPTRRRPPSRA